MHSASTQDVQRMLDQIDLRDPFGVQDHCLLVIAANTGLRVGELVSLDVFDVSHDGQPRLCLFLRAETCKGRKSRIVPLNSVARQAIERLIRFNRSRGFSTEPKAPLFVTKRHRRLTARAVQYIVAELRERAGLAVTLTPHSMRRGFGTEIMRACGNARVAAQLMGHAHVSTSLTYYVHPSEADLANAVERLAQKGGHVHV